MMMIPAPVVATAEWWMLFQDPLDDPENRGFSRSRLAYLQPSLRKQLLSTSRRRALRMLAQQTGESSALGSAEEVKPSNTIRQSPKCGRKNCPLSHSTVSKSPQMRYSFCILYVPNAFIPPLLLRLCQGLYFIPLFDRFGPTVYLLCCLITRVRMFSLHHDQSAGLANSTISCRSSILPSCEFLTARTTAGEN